MQAPIFFFIIHCIAFFALLVNVGLDQDGYDNQTRTFTIRGKIASFGLLPIALLFFGIFVFQNGFDLNFSIVYVGFGITVMAFAIPFLSTSHNFHVKHPVKLNFIGWLTIVIGLSGLFSSVIWAIENKSDAVENYMGVLGQFIAGTSAFIALSGTTIETDTGGRNRLTDLGHVAAMVILIGFLVATINGLIDSKQDDELANTAADTKATLLAADNVINKKLRPNIESVTEQMDYVRRTVIPTLNGILAQLTDLKAISKKIDDVKMLSAKAEKLEEINGKVVESKTTINAIQGTVGEVQTKTQSLENQSSQISQKLDNQNGKLDANATKINELQGKVSSLSQQVDQIDDIKTQLANLAKTLQTIQYQTAKITDLNKDLESIKAKNSQIDGIKKDLESIKTKLENSIENVQPDTTKE